MKALILNNKIVDLAESEFPVDPSLTWMDAPKDCNANWTLEDGVFTAPPDPPEKTYGEKRRKAYPSVGDQLDMLMKDMKNGTTTHQDACEAVKAKFPKP